MYDFMSLMITNGNRHKKFIFSLSHCNALAVVNVLTIKGSTAEKRNEFNVFLYVPVPALYHWLCRQFELQFLQQLQEIEVYKVFSLFFYSLVCSILPKIMNKS